MMLSLLNQRQEQGSALYCPRYTHWVFQNQDTKQGEQIMLEKDCSAIPASGNSTFCWNSLTNNPIQ